MKTESKEENISSNKYFYVGKNSRANRAYMLLFSSDAINQLK